MKIKRYFASDMRQAIRKVREEQGPDAVILSNRRVNGGIEIIAAVDYDESLFDGLSPSRPATETARTGSNTEQPTAPEHPAPAAREKQSNVEWTEDPALASMRKEIQSLRGMLENQMSHLAWFDIARKNPLQASLMQRFSDMGLVADVARDLIARISENGDLDQAWRQGLGLLAHGIRATDDDILTRGGVVSLVGPTGVGKTTMVAKLAARYALRNGKRHVALISTDNFRIGAYEQLHTYGQLLGVPVYSAANKDELHRILEDLYDKQLVLIDTAGMSQRDMRLSEQLNTLGGASPAIRSYLVLSANTHAPTLAEVVQAFRRIKLDGCILTKLDEAASLGSSLSTLIRTQLPVAYIGDGQRVPEDMHPARAHSLVSRAVALMHRSDSSTGGDDASGSNSGNMANAHV
jgi:flagellar biosynthesis protein FlhF